MPWLFSKPETVEPVHIVTTDLATDEEETIESTDCAWCGTGEGVCSMHTAQMFAQSAERREKRGQTR